MYNVTVFKSLIANNKEDMVKYVYMQNNLEVTSSICGRKKVDLKRFEMCKKFRL